MARTTKNKHDQSSWSGSNTVNYADVTLTSEDKDAFLNWMSGVSQDMSTVLQAIMGEGYRVTFKTDFNNQCEMVTFTQQDVKHHNANLVITSRSDDPEEAFWLNVYKVAVMFEGQRLPTQGDRPLWG